MQPRAYTSAEKFNTDKVKHARRATAPTEDYATPVTSAQAYGWHPEKDAKPLSGSFHHRGTELSYFNDAATKHVHGRSVVAERGAYGDNRANTQLTPLATPYAPGSNDRIPLPNNYLERANGHQNPLWPRRAESAMASSWRSGTRYGETFLSTCGRGGDTIAPTVTTLGSTAGARQDQSSSQGFKPLL